MQTIATPQHNAEVVLQDGRLAHIPLTSGNPHTALLWRGGSSYQTPATYQTGLHIVAEQGKPFGVDLSHGGAMAYDPQHKKTVEGIRRCADGLIAAMTEGSLNRLPSVVTFEMNLLEGADTSMQTPGKSWTDACVGLAQGIEIAKQLATAHRSAK
jgi:phospho-2-dehydro-3-deoxyheptonate aldolase